VTDEFIDEVHVPAKEGVIEEYRTSFDETSQKITTEVGHGKCSTCGRVNATVYYHCVQEDLLCANCLIIHEGQTYCRKHIESSVGTKLEAMVLIAVASSLDKTKIKKFATISEQDVLSLKQELERKNYLESKHFGLFGNKVKPTHFGLSAIRTLYQTYIKDNDFQLFIKKLSEAKPDWREVLVITM